MVENRTLLIVDDEAEALRGYEEFLTPKGGSPARKSSRSKEPSSSSAPLESYRLLLASSGKEALELLKKEISEGRRVAAGFFDVKLGEGLDGLQVIQEAWKLDPEIYCVVVTAYHDRTVDEIHTLFGEQFKDQWDYLNKPFTQGEIVQKARQMVSGWNRKKELEIIHQQLLKTEKLASIGQVARGVGHEFGNILLRVVGKADLALMSEDLAKIKEDLKVILSAAEKAGTLARNLQSFSKAEPKFEMTSLTIPIEEALSLVNHELVKASVKLEKKLSPIPESRMDSRSLGQVFLNLFINATHAMKKGGTLTVTLDKGKSSQGKEGIVCKVKDTGSGIPSEILPHVFDFAYTTKGESGSGLGLWISKDIVEAHDGELSVQSQEGKGTEFTLWLPV